MQRIGTVELDLHIFFLDSSRTPARLHLRCEVMPLRTDLLLGVEALRALFPNDNLTRFFIPPSLLASIPEPLTVELTLDPVTLSTVHVKARPEGHLPRTSRQRHPATMVAAVNFMEEVEEEQCRHALHSSPLSNQDA
jgi:hypothetical protein